MRELSTLYVPAKHADMPMPANAVEHHLYLCEDNTLCKMEIKPLKDARSECLQQR